MCATVKGVAVPTASVVEWFGYKATAGSPRNRLMGLGDFSEVEGPADDGFEAIAPSGEEFGLGTTPFGFDFPDAFFRRSICVQAV